MKQVFVLAAMLLSGFIFTINGKAQNLSLGNVTGNFLTANPPQISNEIFRFRPGLATQLFNGALPTGVGSTGFGGTDRWLSFGQVAGGAQTLQGFRTQANGRGLAFGHSLPNVGTVSSPFIEWIGIVNNESGPPAVVTQPGNLEFKYALNPTGALGARVPIFTMSPAFTTSTLPTFTIPSFNYAETNAFVGQKQSGTFGLFGTGDTWSATGQITVPSPVNLTTYGARHQFESFTVNSGLLKDVNTGKVSGILDFGKDVLAPSSQVNANPSFKFRVFTDPNIPSSVKNVWQSSVLNGNVMMGRQDISTVNANQFYLSVYDGAPISPTVDQLLVSRAAIYATSNTLDENGAQIPSYAAVVGDLRFASLSVGTSKYAILGLSAQSQSLPKLSNWAGYFVGNVGYTGGLVQVSDKKFKTEIKDEVDILSKIMQLKPQQYFFDTKTYKSMTFSDKLQHGLISQDVEKIFPELVLDASAPVSDASAKGNEIEYKGLNYIGLIPMLIKAVQELKAENDALKTRLEKLETTTSKNTFVLTDKTNLPTEIESKAFTLSQNTPNPFSEKTTISYTIPSNVKKATLAVFDLTGKMLLQYNLQNGKNTVAINGSTLPAGMYLYSLLADGQEVLSKRMVLTK